VKFGKHFPPVKQPEFRASKGACWLEGNQGDGVGGRMRRSTGAHAFGPLTCRCKDWCRQGTRSRTVSSSTEVLILWCRPLPWSTPRRWSAYTQPMGLRTWPLGTTWGSCRPGRVRRLFRLLELEGPFSVCCSCNLIRQFTNTARLSVFATSSSHTHASTVSVTMRHGYTYAIHLQRHRLEYLMACFCFECAQKTFVKSAGSEVAERACRIQFADSAGEGLPSAGNGRRTGLGGEVYVPRLRSWPAWRRRTL
jgi:hypothetical protein